MLTYIDALSKTRHINEAKRICLEQLNKKFEPDLLSELIYLSLDSNDKPMLSYIMKRFKDKPEQYKSLTPSFIYLYLYFENGQKALNLANDLQKNPTVDNELLYADVVSLYGDREEALGIRHKAWVEMKKELKSNPQLFNDANFLENFLGVSMRFDHYKEFNKILDLSKNIIPLNTYYDFKLSYELFRNHREKALYLQKKYKYILKPWMMLDIALWNRDTYLQEKLLKEWSDTLPIRDRVEAFQETGNIGGAFEYAFKGLEENRKDYLLYDQFRNIANNYSNIVDFNTQYISWNGYREASENISFKYHFPGGIIVTPFIQIGKEISYNTGDIINVPSKHYNIGITFEKEYLNYNLKASLGVISSLYTNPYFSINPSCKITNSTEVEFLYGEHVETDDNLFLYLGGLKRELQASLRQEVTQRMSFNISVNHDWFLSQNNKTIGSDNGIYSELDYRLREAYPDYTIRTFLQAERYHQNGGKGDIAELSPYSNFDPLPSSYNLGGIGFSIGNNYKGTLENRWRPFLNGDLFYETNSGTGYDVGGGYGGPVLGNDNLSVATSYYTNFHGSSSSYFQLSVSYKIYF
ncbi:MAG: tetratricopeptide repeat protein, partial [Candidatus Anstonellales archaeon]